MSVGALRNLLLNGHPLVLSGVDEYQLVKLVLHQSHLGVEVVNNALHLGVEQQIFLLKFLLQVLYLLLHCLLIVEKMTDTVVEILVLSLEVCLASATAHVVFFALSIQVD